jgi:hypothetical protein
MLPARRASSDVNSWAVPFWWAAFPPSLAISRWRWGSIDANPRFLVPELCLLPWLLEAMMLSFDSQKARNKVARPLQKSPQSAADGWRQARDPTPETAAQAAGSIAANVDERSIHLMQHYLMRV